MIKKNNQYLTLLLKGQIWGNDKESQLEEGKNQVEKGITISHSKKG